MAWSRKNWNFARFGTNLSDYRRTSGFAPSGLGHSIHCSLNAGFKCSLKCSATPPHGKSHVHGYMASPWATAVRCLNAAWVAVSLILYFPPGERHRYCAQRVLRRRPTCWLPIWVFRRGSYSAERVFWRGGLMANSIFLIAFSTPLMLNCCGWRGGGSKVGSFF